MLNLDSLDRRERLRIISELHNLTVEEVAALSSKGGLGLDSADRMSENVIGIVQRPLAIVPGLVINGKEYSVPLVTEQNTIISMFKRGVKFSKQSGGFNANNTGSTMMGQIQLLEVPDLTKAQNKILSHKQEILGEANTLSSRRRATDVKVRALDTKKGPMLIVELYVDVKDSMGANIVNAMCEIVTPRISSLTMGRAGIRVLSNLTTERMIKVDVAIDSQIMGGIEVVNNIVLASHFAEADPYRASTHNKGIMNGVTSVLFATSNDTRAVEAGAHAYAALSGQYRPLSTWRRKGEQLIGELVMPMAVGLVGGSTSTHPTAKSTLKILGVKTATELGEVAASAGLACNLGALHALVTEGVTSIEQI